MRGPLGGGCLRTLLTLATLRSTVAQVRAQALCASTSDSLSTPDSARLSPGTYALVIVATLGPQRGGRTQGLLTLRSTSANDRSPRTGQAPARKENRLGTPLWGTFAADISGVGAPLPDSGEAYIPQPNADDPIFPGVIVFVQN